MAEMKLKEYIEPEMKIKNVDFADIIVTSTPEGEQGVVNTDIPRDSNNDPWTTAT